MLSIFLTWIKRFIESRSREITQRNSPCYDALNIHFEGKMRYLVSISAGPLAWAMRGGI